MQLVRDLGPRHGVASTCKALGVSRATYYRSCTPRPEPAPRPAPPRALTEDERRMVLETLYAPRFVDLAPAEIYATLLDESQYLCSERTMYRILAANAPVRERRDVLRHPQYAAPELLATRSKELWSWDITKLLGPTKWSYFYLYVIMDVFSRKVVGWMVAENESAALARKLIFETAERQGIEPGTLTVHADRGASMRSKLVAELMADLGITKTHSRPHVSNDNPYSESNFKTLKYRPGFPDRFLDVDHARSVCGDVIDWYNNEHHHVGLGLLTPSDVHDGLADSKIAQRAHVLEQAHAVHPDRFTRGVPKPARPPKEVWINKPRIATIGSIPGTTAQIDAQRSPRTSDLDPGSHRSTPDSRALELLEVAQ
jgi:putative transposase